MRLHWKPVYFLVPLSFFLAVMALVNFARPFYDFQDHRSIVGKSVYFVNTWIKPSSQGPLSKFKNFELALDSSSFWELKNIQMSLLESVGESPKSFIPAERYQNFKPTLEILKMHLAEDRLKSSPYPTATTPKLNTAKQEQQPESEIFPPDLSMFPTVSVVGAVQNWLIGKGSYGKEFLPGAQLLLNDSSLNKDLFSDHLYAFKNAGAVPKLPAEQTLVKYLVGYPGDLILMYRNALFVNGIYIKPLDPTIQHALEQRNNLDGSAGDGIRYLVVPNDKYFVVGDSPLSIDSAYYGFIDRKQLIGKVILSL